MDAFKTEEERLRVVNIIKMTKKEFKKLAKKHLTIEEKQSMAFGRKFKYIGGIEELYKAMNFTRCCKSDS